MNIRKNIDYTEMYEALDELMAQQLPQMELYCGIGKAVCRRTEKGAAVMASEYLNRHYPDAKGFSPRSLRRMRDFYRTYENHPALLSRAMKLGWTQNVVIMEADLTMELREWYMKAAEQFGWTKAELISNIMSNVYKNIILATEEKMYYPVVWENKHLNIHQKGFVYIVNNFHRFAFSIKNRLLMRKNGRRRCVLHYGRQSWRSIILSRNLKKNIKFKGSF